MASDTKISFSFSFKDKASAKIKSFSKTLQAIDTIVLSIQSSFVVLDKTIHRVSLNAQSGILTGMAEPLQQTISQIEDTTAAYLIMGKTIKNGFEIAQEEADDLKKSVSSIFEGMGGQDVAKEIKHVEASLDEIKKSADETKKEMTFFERVVSEVKEKVVSHISDGISGALNGVIDNVAATALSFLPFGKTVSRSLGVSEDAIEKTQNAFSFLDIAVGTIIGNIASAIIEKLGSAILQIADQISDLNKEFGSSSRKIKQHFGTAADGADAMERSVKSIWRNGFADVETATDAVIAVRQNMGNLAEGELTEVATGLVVVSDLLGEDVSGAANTAGTLMKQFGMSSQQALDFLAAGLQQGLNTSEDFLDTVGEYSNQFASLGFTADEFFSILQTGLQGGVLGTDKIADAVKEFGIRMQDGSDTTRNALADLFEAVGGGAGNIERIKAEMATYSEAIATNERVIAIWEKKVADSQAEVDRLSTALSTARDELAAMASPNLIGMKEFDDAMFGMGMAAKSVQLEIANMLDENSVAFQQAARDANAHNQAIYDIERAMSETENGIASAESELEKWRDELKRNEEQAKFLEQSLSDAKRALDDLSRPKLAGMEEYDDKLFQLEQKAKKARLAMVGMDKDSPGYEKAQKNLDKINDEIDKVSLQRDIKFEPQLRAIEKAASTSTEAAMSFDQVMSKIGERKNEIAGLEKAISANDATINNSQNSVSEWEQNLASAKDELDRIAAQRDALGDLTNALEMLKDSEGYKDAEARLEAINSSMERMQLGYDIQFEPQLRAIADAAKEGEAPAISFADAMQGIADKKEEIRGLEGALAGAQEQLRQHTEGLDQMNKVLEANKAHLVGLEAELEMAMKPGQDILDGIRDGSMSVADALPRVLDSLRQIKDPLEQNRIGTELFGSQWEDMTAQGILAIDQFKFKLSDFDGSMENMVKAGVSSSQVMTSAWNGILEAILPIQDAFQNLSNDILLPLATKYAPPVAEWLGGAIPQAIDYLKNTVAPAIQQYLPELANWFADIATQYAPPLQEWLGNAIPKALDYLKNTVAPAIQQYLPELAVIVGDVLPSALSIAKQTIDALSAAFEYLSPLLSIAKKAFDLTVSAVEAVISVFVNLQAASQGVISPFTAVKNVFLDTATVLGKMVQMISDIIAKVTGLDKAFAALKPPEWLADIGEKVSGAAKDLKIPGFADGGTFTGGKPIIVGERGPEVILPRASGTVVPNNQLGGSRNVSLSINVQGSADSSTVAQIEAVLHRAIDQLIGQGNL